ncbi:MAG: biopolymer transporter ExbD [Terriglobia bacterium]
MGYKPKTPDIMPDINVVPMADVMLVLLIIFMVVTPMMQMGFSVELASTENPREMPDADREDAVLIAITRDGRVYLGTQQITFEQINEKVRDRLLTPLGKTVYVKSDARARYRDVVRVVDEVRATGVDKIGLLTEKIERKRRPPGLEMPVRPGATP